MNVQSAAGRLLGRRCNFNTYHIVRRNFEHSPRTFRSAHYFSITPPLNSSIHNRCYSFFCNNAVIGCLATPKIIAGSDSAKRIHATITKRRWLSSSGSKKNTTTYGGTRKTLSDIYNHVRTHHSLDIWTINVMLLAFIAGPVVWTSMKKSNRRPESEDIPVDDPVEHSVRILIESTAKSDQDQAMEYSSGSNTTNNVTIISPEEDAKRILNDLFESDNVRTTASRIASNVIQSPPFQNAVRVLVRNIWDDLVNDPETTTQLTTLVYTVLQNEKVYAAVKDLLLELVKDEEVYHELTKLVVKLGEEQEVIDATQQLLTESAHRTLNDQNVLDHSMEFATEVVGDDVVQRTGGEALRNTVGYAVQPSGGALLMGVGTILVAGCLHLYLSRRGGGGGGGEVSVSGGDALHSSESIMREDITIMSHPPSTTQSFEPPPTSLNGIGGTTAGHNNPSSDNSMVASFFLGVVDVLKGIFSFPSVLLGSIRSSIGAIIAFPSFMSEKCSSGWEWLCGNFLLSVVYIFNIPSQLGSSMMALADASYLWTCSKGTTILSGCQSVAALAAQKVSCWSTFVIDGLGHLAMVITEYLRQTWSNSVSPTI